MIWNRASADIAASVGLILLALTLVVFGVRTALFAGEEARSREQPPAEAAARLERWADTAPVGSLALTKTVQRREIEWRAGRLDGAALEHDLARLLSKRPAYGPGWIALANVRLARGAPLEEVLAAADMSSGVAPRESAVMLARVDLGLRLWEQMDRPRQISMISDLVAVGPMLSEIEMARLRPLMLTRTGEEIADLSVLVKARSGGALPDWAQWLGLSASAEAPLRGSR